MTPATRSLLRAAADGDAGLVRALLAQGTDINGKTGSGQTPLMLAAAFGHESVVKVLVAAGADINIEDELGLSAREWAAKTPAIAELLNGNPPASEEPDEEVSSDNVAPIVAAPESDSAVVFPKPRTHPVDRADILKPALGGLAGAILRDRAVKPAAETETSGVQFASPATTEELSEEYESIEPVTVPVPETISGSNEVAFTPIDDADAEIQTPSFEEEEKLPTPEGKVAPSEVVEEPEEITVSGPRRASTETVETLGGGRTLIPREPVVHHIDDAGPNQISKVQVAVPSFESVSERGGARPLRWLLVILFLVAGASGGYFLSDYMLKRDARPTVEPNVQPVSQPTPQPSKPGPVVDAGLAGGALFLPDAEYPNIEPSAEGGYPSGKVTVSIQVDQHGSVISATAVDGDVRLQPQAVAAAKRAAFSPDKVRVKGQVTSGAITYTFVPPQSSTTATQKGSTGPTKPAADTASPGTQAEQSSSPKVGGDLSGAESDLPQPVYPPKLRTAGVAGTVTIVVRVNRAGRVVSWRTADGDTRLRSVALAAAKKSTFAPAKLPGTGDVVGTITYTFK